MNRSFSHNALLFCVMLLVGCAESDTPETAPSQSGVVPPAGWELVEIDAEAFTALREQAKADGVVLVVDGWATWCDSCVAMFPLLHQEIKAKGDKVRLVSLCFDEGDDYIAKAMAYLITQQAWQDAYLAAPGADAKETLAEATSTQEGWGGGVLPAVFVYRPDGTLAYEMLQTEGNPKDWVQQIGAAVDRASGD